MGAIKYKILVSFLLLFNSCALFQSGYTDRNGQYTPKHPNYKLKNKKGCISPSNLDTINIYKMVEIYSKEGLLLNLNSSVQIKSVFSFIKFYRNKRCLFFSIPTKDEFGNINKLKETDLNPNNRYYNKNYYCSNQNGGDIRIESFTHGDGYGTYVTVKYSLDLAGDALIFEDKYLKIVYKKEEIPLNWNKYKINW